MAKIKNTGSKNIYGDGNVKKVTLGNGHEYYISNTGSKNIYGDGYEQKITSKEDNHSFNYGFIDTYGWIASTFMLISVFGIPVIIPVCWLYGHTILGILITAGSWVAFWVIGCNHAYKRGGMGKLELIDTINMMVFGFFKAWGFVIVFFFSILYLLSKIF